MNNSRTINTIRNATVNLAARMCTMICAFVIRTIFLKYFGEQYTGVSTLFTDILNILSFTELGIGAAISYAFYKPVAQGDDLRIAQLMKLCKYIYRIISVSVLLIGLAFTPFIGYFVKNVPDIKESITKIYLLYVIKTSLSYLLIYKSTLIIAKQKQYVVTATESAIVLAKTILDVFLLIISKNFMVYLYIEIVSVLITNLLISILANRELNDAVPPKNVKIHRNDFKSLFKNVKDVFIYKINGIVLNSTDSLIISNAIDISTVTYISNYNLIFNAINNIAYQIISALTASVGNLAILKTQKEQQDVFETINLLCFSISSIVITGLWLCTNHFIEIIWGKQYVLSTGIVLLLCANLYITIMYMAVDVFRMANGIFHKGRLRPLVTAILNLIISIIAVRYLGLLGVLLGTVLSRVLTQVWYDPKLVFNIVFQGSVKPYYLKYTIYTFTIILCCICGNFIENSINANALISLVVGFIFAILINILAISIFYKKTTEYAAVIKYLKNIFKIHN